MERQRRTRLEIHEAMLQRLREVFAMRKAGMTFAAIGRHYGTRRERPRQNYREALRRIEYYGEIR